MGRRSSGFMFAFMVNLAAFFINLGLALIWHHEHAFGPMVINSMAAAFSGTLAFINLIRYQNAVDDERMDAIRNRISY